MSGENELIMGVCCVFCNKEGENDCPVREANPWSKFKNFCSEFENSKFKLKEIISVNPDKIFEGKKS